MEAGVCRCRATSDLIERKRAEGDEAETRRKAAEEAKREPQEKGEGLSAQPIPQAPRPRSATEDGREHFERVASERTEREIDRLKQMRKYVAQVIGGVFLTGFIMGITQWLWNRTDFWRSLFVTSLYAFGLAAGLVVANRPPRMSSGSKLLTVALSIFFCSCCRAFR